MRLSRRWRIHQGRMIIHPRAKWRSEEERRTIGRTACCRRDLGKPSKIRLETGKITEGAGKAIDPLPRMRRGIRIYWKRRISAWRTLKST